MAGAKLFGQDGPFIRFGTFLFDIILVSLLWVLTSGVLVYVVVALWATDWLVTVWGLLLLVAMFLHIGPATAAGFYVMSRRQREVGTYIFKEFFAAYAENYKKGIALSAILFLILGSLGFCIYVELLNLHLFGRIVILLLIVQGMFVLVGLFLYLYLFPLLARFELRIRDYLRLGFLMSIKHLPITALCLVILAAAVAGSLFFTMLIILLPGLSLYFKAALMEKVFRRYMPDEDRELEEETFEDYDMDAERQAIIDRYTGHSHDYSGEAPSVTYAGEEQPEAQVTYAGEETDSESTSRP